MYIGYIFVTLLPILPLIWRSRSSNNHRRKNQPQLGPVHTCGGLAGGDPAGAGAGGGDVPSASSQVGYTNTALVRVKAGVYARIGRSAAESTKAFLTSGQELSEKHHSND